MEITKVVIFDLDGTAIPSKINGLPSQRLQNAIRDSDESLIFCAATGRSWMHAKTPIATLGLHSPCIISGGTQIINPNNKELLWEVTISDQSLTDIFRIARLYSKKVALVTGLDVTEPKQPGKIIRSVNTVYMFDIEVQELNTVTQMLNDVGDITAALTKSWHRQGVTDLHITHKKATKEHAIKQLLKILDVPKARTIGIGDGHNDIHLFKSVGLKVAMGNAELELKQKADMVIDSIKHDGLAKFLEEISLTKEAP